MPDGFEVGMEYKVAVDIDGCVIEGNVEPTLTKVTTDSGDNYFKNVSFSTTEYDYASFGRKGFVNMIQAVDAQIARRIIHHTNRLGADHIVAIHDCFRVNIHDMAILKEAIKCAYHDLFTDFGTELPMGQDILGMYFKGSLEATADEYVATAPAYSQFKDNGKRKLMRVNGEYVSNLINALGDTYYFAK